MTRAVVHIVVILFFSVPALSQTANPADWLREINRDIWNPFLEGVRNYRDELYLGVHSRDYVRIDSANRFFLGRADYDDDTIKMMARYKSDGSTITMNVRFDERIVNGRLAFERGVNEVIMTDKNGASRKFYGRFHVVSRKEGDRWKMLTEYLPPETIGVNDFLSARAIDDFTPFLCYMPYPEKKLVCPPKR